MHWASKEEVIDNNWKIIHVQLDVGCSGWGCYHDPSCPGHDRVVVEFGSERLPKTLDHGEVFDLPRKCFTKRAWYWLQSQR